MKKVIYSDVTLSLPHIKYLMYNFLRGLRYLHSAGVYHRDLKPANVLVNENCTVKIADFNLSRVVVVDHKRPESPGVTEPIVGLASGPVRPSTARTQRQLT